MAFCWMPTKTPSVPYPLIRATSTATRIRTRKPSGPAMPHSAVYSPPTSSAVLEAMKPLTCCCAYSAVRAMTASSSRPPPTHVQGQCRHQRRGCTVDPAEPRFFNCALTTFWRLSDPQPSLFSCAHRTIPPETCCIDKTSGVFYWTSTVLWW